MRKPKFTLSNRIFMLSLLLLRLCGLSLQALQQEFSVTEEIRQEVNLLQSEKLRLMYGYNLILIQYQSEMLNSNNSTENFLTNSGQLPPSTQSSPESSTVLRDLLSQGGNLFETLDNQLAELQEQLTNSETTITGLQILLSEAKETIAQLSENLIQSQLRADQIQVLLQENNEDLAAAHEHLDTLSRQNTLWKNEAAELQKQAGKTGLIGFGFAGLGFGLGTPLIAEGIRSDNQAMVWAGAGSIIGTTGIWLLGHFVFKWW